jgi:hypothetical protein
MSGPAIIHFSQGAAVSMCATGAMRRPDASPTLSSTHATDCGE